MSKQGDLSHLNNKQIVISPSSVLHTEFSTISPRFYPVTWRRLERPVGWKQDSRMPRVHMDLVAVVCIETSHYVSFVRCGDTLRSPWAFFDSMADRKGKRTGD